MGYELDRDLAFGTIPFRTHSLLTALGD